MNITKLIIFLSGFPFFVSGRSAPTGQFFPTHVSLSSHEDTSAWMFSYNFVKDVAGKTPRYRMGDGAKEITKAGLEVFGAHGDRLMCWPHTYRNTYDHLLPLRKEDPSLADKVMSDIEFLQLRLNHLTNCLLA